MREGHRDRLNKKEGNTGALHLAATNIMNQSSSLSLTPVNSSIETMVYKTNERLKS